MNTDRFKINTNLKQTYAKALCCCFVVMLITALGSYVSKTENGGSLSGVSGISCVPDSASEIKTKVVDHVYFGSYPQTEDGTVQPIEWRVLDVKDGRALMISEYLLDCKKYNDADEGVNWESCALRNWLNDDFYNTAFSEDEKKRIVKAENDNPDNPQYGIEGGSPTEDYVFCLSIDEANEYFSDEKDRRAQPTAYTKKKGAYVSVSNGNGWWWLRTPGIDYYTAVSVSYNGVIHEEGRGIRIHLDCVRPVVLVSLSDQS